jgi:hypothetical protein
MKTAHVSRSDGSFPCKSVVGLLLFLLLYPLDTIFHAAGATIGYNIPVGMVGIIIAFISIPLIFFERNKALLFNLIFFCISFLVIFFVFLSERSGLQDYYFWIRTIALFTAGYLFFFWLRNYRPKRYFDKNLVLLSLLLIIMIAVPFTLATDDLNYLRLSTGFLFSALLYYSFIDSNKTKVALLPFVLYAMFLFESRFSIMAFVLLFMLVSYLETRKLYKLIIVILFLLFAFIFYWLGYYYFNSLENIHSNRLLRLIYATNQDTSLSSRSELLHNAYAVFLNNPFWGDYKYYRDLGQEGAYSHNFISFWAELGIVGIIYTLMIFILSIITAIKAKKLLPSNPPVARFVLYISILLVLGIVFAKSYVWSVIYYALGFCSAFLFNESFWGDTKL